MLVNDNFLGYKAGAMGFHVAMLAVFVEQTKQLPIVVQYAPLIPEPAWKWWLGALAPWVGPLLSCIVSIYVAKKVFRWQSDKDRTQWVLDQKKLEWNQLLSAVYACQIYDFGHSVEMKHSGNGLLLPAALQIDQMNKVDHLMGCPIFMDAKALEPSRFQLGQLKKKRIVTTDAMEDIYGSDPQWKGREAQWRNILWIPSEERDKLLQSICESARKDLGIR
jgi:hypothetical protein